MEAVQPRLHAIPVSTTFDIPGRRIARHVGPVFGVTVRTRAIGPKLMAAFRNIGGGEVVTYTRLANQVRHEAMDRMVAEAQRMGANAVVGMRFDRPRRPVVTGRATGLRSGLAYVRRSPVLAALLGALGVVSMLALQANVIMPSLAHRVFGREAQGYSGLLTAYGAGAVITALRLASRKYTDAQYRQNLLLGLGGMAMGLLVVAASPRYELALLGQLVAGFGMLRYTATTNALVQLLVDDGFRGRVMGLHTVMFVGTAPFGALVLGTIGARFGPQVAVAVSGAGACLVAVWLATRLPRKLLGTGAPE